MKIARFRGPVRLKNKEAGRIIWQMALGDLTKHFVKIVTGEGLSVKRGKTEGILRDSEFLRILEKFMRENKKIMIIFHIQEGKEGLKASLCQRYSSDQIERIKEAIKKGNLYIYLSPERPKWHFANIDGAYLFIQRQHDPDAPSSKKDWLYTDDERFPLEYNNYFDIWAKECYQIQVEDII
jgi:hypothetical protein